MSKKVAQVLESAAKKLEKHGWIRGVLGSKNDGYCVVGAINASTGKWNLRDKAWNAVSYVISNDRVARWNDNDCGNKRQAIESLYAAASLALSNRGVF